MRISIIKTKQIKISITNRNLVLFSNLKFVHLTFGQCSKSIPVTADVQSAAVEYTFLCILKEDEQDSQKQKRDRVKDETEGEKKELKLEEHEEKEMKRKTGVETDLKRRGKNINMHNNKNRTVV